MHLIKKNIILFVLLFVLFVVLVFQAIFSILFPVVKIRAFFPPNNSVDVPTTIYPRVVFEKTPKNNQIDISFYPKVVFNSKITNNQLEIMPKKSLKPGIDYVLEIKDKTRNKEIVKINFTTIKPQGSPNTPKELEKDLKENFPLAPYSPPDNAFFYFLYTNPQQIKVFLKGNQETAKEEFYSWVKSKGVDLSKHQINFVSPP